MPNDPVQPVQIELTRSGGFAGRRLHVSLRSSDLPPEQAAAVSDLLERVDLPALASRPQTSPRRPDEFLYELSVAGGDRQDHLTVADHEVTPELRALVTRLVELARLGRAR